MAQAPETQYYEGIVRDLLDKWEKVGDAASRLLMDESDRLAKRITLLRRAQKAMEKLRAEVARVKKASDLAYWLYVVLRLEADIDACTNRGVRWIPSPKLEGKEESAAPVRICSELVKRILANAASLAATASPVKKAPRVDGAQLRQCIRDEMERLEGCVSQLVASCEDEAVKNDIPFLQHCLKRLHEIIKVYASDAPSTPEVSSQQRTAGLTVDTALSATSSGNGGDDVPPKEPSSAAVPQPISVPEPMSVPQLTAVSPPARVMAAPFAALPPLQFFTFDPTGRPPSEVKDALRKFYLKFNPEKLDSLDTIVKEYANNELALFHALENKYVAAQKPVETLSNPPDASWSCAVS